MAGPTTSPDSEWQRKGATLSNKTAREEFGLTDAQLHAAIRSGKLQHRVGSTFENPFLRLLRREVEDLVTRTRGGAYLEDQRVKTELAGIGRETKCLKGKIAALEKRRAELVGGGAKTPTARLR